MRTPAPNPCNECPWRRTSLRGNTGPLSAEEWTLCAHSDEEIACHLTLDAWWSEPRHCSGADIYRSNVYKRPRWLDHEQLGADRLTVFASPAEFQEHHR